MCDWEEKLHEPNKSTMRQELFRQLLAGEITPEQYAVQSTKLEARPDE